MNSIDLSNLVRTLLEKNLKKGEEILISYKQYQIESAEGYGKNKNHKELSWILTNQALLQLDIVNDNIKLKMFSLDKIVSIDKSFDLAEDAQLIYNYAKVKFNNGDECNLYPPKTRDLLDSIKNYKALVEMLRG